MALNPLSSWSVGLTRTDPPVSPPRGRPTHAGTLEVVTEQGRARASLEHFIGARFAAAYDAKVTHFGRHLVGIRDPSRRWRASAGYTPACDEPLFLESYLAAPIEQVLARGRPGPVERVRVVEVGNLAATSAGMGRDLMEATVRHLHEAGFAWVVFTATRELRHLLARLRVPLQSIASADPTRLSDRGASWGRYYAHDPHVMAVALAAAIQVGRAR